MTDSATEKPLVERVNDLVLQDAVTLSDAQLQTMVRKALTKEVGRVVQDLVKNKVNSPEVKNMIENLLKAGFEEALKNTRDRIVNRLGDSICEALYPERDY